MGYYYSENRSAGKYLLFVGGVLLLIALYMFVAPPEKSESDRQINAEKKTETATDILEEAKPVAESSVIPRPTITPVSPEQNDANRIEMQIKSLLSEGRIKMNSGKLEEAVERTPDKDGCLSRVHRVDEAFVNPPFKCP